jgi:hypothetical protein
MAMEEKAAQKLERIRISKLKLCRAIAGRTIVYKNETF